MKSDRLLRNLLLIYLSTSAFFSDIRGEDVIILEPPELHSSDEGRILPDWNFYQRLNVTNDATFAEIKSSYRRHIIYFHPDKLIHNFTKEEKEDRLSQFLLIQEAYEVLSNPYKRSAYDSELISKSAESGIGRNTPGRENSNEFWSSSPSLQTDGIMKMFIYSAKNNLKLKMNFRFPPILIPDISIPLDVSMLYYFDGGELNTSYHRRRICSLCNGTGSFENQHKVCEDCLGNGYNWRKFEKDGINYQQMSYSKCEKCLGKGIIIIKKCPLCGGVGFHYQESWFMVQVPCGFYPFQKYLYRSLGHESKPNQFGDIEVELRYDLPDGYKMEEMKRDPENPAKITNSTGNIFYNHNITLSDLHNSSHFIFDYLTGDELKVNIPEGITVEDILNGYEIRQEKLGLFPNITTINEQGYEEIDQSILLNPELQCNHEKRGDLIVKLSLNWKEITAQQVIDSMLVCYLFFSSFHLHHY
jgi:DnaJ-class molecular chaperone